MAKVDLSGRVAIVTGAGAGLGRTHALDLAKHGASVVVNDLGGSRDGSGKGSEAADKVVAEIKAAGGKAVANYDNVVTGGDKIVKTAVDAFGKVDILVNNAGILRDKSFAKMEEADFDLVMNVHVKGTYSCCKAVWGLMRDQKYGRIVNTTSGAGILGNFGQTNYAAAKCAIVGIMNVLKLEGAKNNIFINCLAPMAASRLTEDVMPPMLLEKAKPEFVTPIVTYLCSEQSSENGSIFNAGMGYFSRSAMMTGPGWVSKGNVTADDIMANWGKITSLDNCKFFEQVNQQMAEFLRQE